MSYYMRYFVTDTKPVTLDILESALKNKDAAYAIADKVVDKLEYGVIMYGDELYGEIDINRPNDGLFEEEIVEFRESFDDEPQIDATAVLSLLDNTKLIVAVRVLWQGRDSEATLIQLIRFGIGSRQTAEVWRMLTAKASIPMTASFLM